MSSVVKLSILIAMEISVRSQKKAGRPLSFDRGEALQKAMLLFWRHGYEATSLNELTVAMGVTPPSVYAAFGNKRGLFLEAVGLYLSHPSSPQQIMDAEPTARAAARALMLGAAAAFTDPATPPGCMLATSAISVSAAAADVQAELAGLRNAVEAHLRRRIERAQAEGELPSDIDAEALAGHTTAAIQGMSTLARDGASHDKLMRVVAMAMRVWG